jgi:mycofactocin precursor peptide peptidase
MPGLDEVPWPRVGAAQLVVIPLGATEQHGPHLPFTVDTAIAVALSRAVVDEVPGAYLAPALPFGASGEHQGFPGTLSIGTEATSQVLVELGRSAGKTFARTLFVCAHGGNAEALSRAVGVLRAEGRVVRAWAPGWSGDAHAGELETSVMLALDAGRVMLDAAAAGETRPIAELMDDLRDRGVRAVSPNGVLGDPAGATAARGRELLAAETGRLTRMVRAWMSGA